MFEIEIKYRIKSKKSWLLLQEEIEAEYSCDIKDIKDIKMIDYYYRKNGDMSERIRHDITNNIYYHTIKKGTSFNTDGFKTREETEKRVYLSPTKEELSESYLQIEKNRKEYDLKNKKIAFDFIEGLGYFIEVEYLLESPDDYESDSFLTNKIEKYGKQEKKSYRILAEETFLE